MKAQGYVDIFTADPSVKTVAKIASMLIEEIKEIAVARHAKSDEAMIAIFKEQDQKWRKICRLVPGFKPSGFRDLLQEVMPELCKEVPLVSLWLQETK